MNAALCAGVPLLPLPIFHRNVETLGLALNKSRVMGNRARKKVELGKGARQRSTGV